MRTLHILALFALLVPLAGDALAATFHVAREAPGASDSNDGLSPVYVSGNHGPWLTVRHATEMAAAGDEVLVYDGDYRDEPTGYGTGVVAIENSGTTAAPIRFAAAQGEKPILNTILIYEREWIVVDGFTLVSRDFTLPPNWRDMPEVVIDDPSIIIDPDEPWETREEKVRQKYATYMAMHDFFYTEYTTGFDVKQSSHVAIRNNTIELYSFGIQVRDTSSDLLVEGNRISHCADAFVSWDPIPAIADSTIRRNTVQQNFNGGIAVRDGATRVVVENNRGQFNGTSHISVQGGGTDIIVRRNIGRFGGYYSETMRYPGSSSINVHTSGPGIVVEDNVAAYQIDLTGNDGNGFMADLMLGGAGVLFRNNISFRNMGSGIRTVESPNSVMVNNTLIQNGWEAVNPRGGAGINLSQDEDVDQTIVNNIFFDNATAGIKSYLIIDDQIGIDHNLYYSAGGAPFIWDGYEFGDRAYGSLAEVRENTPWEAHGVAGDPLFIDPAAKNFRLLSGSPAIDAGAPLPWVRDDFDGRPRPQGEGFDIGAFEAE